MGENTSHFQMLVPEDGKQLFPFLRALAQPVHPGVQLEVNGQGFPVFFQKPRVGRVEDSLGKPLLT